jgi:hypothetical protein
MIRKLLFIVALLGTAFPVSAIDYIIMGDRTVQSENGYAVGAEGAAIAVIDASGNFTIGDSLDLLFGGSSDVGFRWNTAQTQDALSAGLGASNSFIIMEKADVGTDLALAAATHPTLFIADAAASDTLSLGHASAGVAAVAAKNDLVVRSGQANLDTLTLQGYDVDGAAWDSNITITSGNTPGVTIASDGSFVLNTGNLDGLGGMEIILCGDLENAATNYLGPATEAFYNGGADYSPNSTACDALDSTTEATADAPIMTNTTFKIAGMFCHNDDAATGNIVYTMRSAAADVTPTVTCTVATGESDCWAQTATSTDIAAGATIAVKAVPAADESSNDGWCKVLIAPQT